MSESLFTQMLRESGMPVTDDEMRERWDAINEEQGSQITNDSNWSPFWRLISAIVTEPFKQLVELLVSTALPNLFLQYAAGQWLDVLAWGVDVERKAATYAQGVITFTRENSSGDLAVPGGTVVESPSVDGAVYQLVVEADTVIQDGQLSMDVPVRAAEAGADYNLGPGYYSILPQPVSGIASVTNGATWLTTPGADAEADEELRLRCRNQFSAVGQYHHDAAYRADIASFAGIRTDYIYFEHDAPRGPGSANAYVMIASGPAPQDFVDEINAHVRDSGNHGHGDDLLCFPMPVTALDLAAVVHPLANLDDDRREALRAGVENRIRAAFRDNADYDVTRTWPFSRFSLSRLDKELHEQLADLLSVEFVPADDIVTEMALPLLGTLAVTLGDE